MKDPRWVGVPGAARRVEASETFVRLLATMDLVPSRTTGSGSRQRLEVDIVELARQVPKYRSVAAQQKLIRDMAHRLEGLTTPGQAASPDSAAGRRRRARAAEPPAPESAPPQPGGALIPLSELSGLFDRLAEAERRAVKAEAQVSHFREQLQLLRQRQQEAEAVAAVAPRRRWWRRGS